MNVLIIEDGDEYLESLSRFVPGPNYAQVHTGREALASLQREPADVIYLDMRFDRIPAADLLGDLEGATARHNGSAERAQRYLANNQGLFILEALRTAGLSHIPVLLSYDFSNERARFSKLSQRHPNLSWIPDAISPEEIRARLARLTGMSA